MNQKAEDLFTEGQVLFRKEKFNAAYDKFCKVKEITYRELKRKHAKEMMVDVIEGAEKARWFFRSPTVLSTRTCHH